MQKRSTTINRRTYTTSHNAVVGTLSNVNYPQRMGLHASRQRLEIKYKRDAEIHLQLQKEKEQKKRLEKLKRYEGVGLLGNKMIDNNVTQLSEERKILSLRSSREMAQNSYDFQACSRSAHAIESQRIELEKEQKKRLEKLKRYEGVGLLGNKMIDNNVTQLLEENKILSLRSAREMAQNSYDFQACSRSTDAIESQRIELEKEQRKRLEKLKRYEGVGLLGNKMIDNNITQLSEENKKSSLRSAREMAQNSYDFQACSRSTDAIESQRVEIEKEQKKRLEKSKRFEGVGLLGNKMIDNNVTQLSEENKKLSLRSARDMAQNAYDFQACSRSIDAIESERIGLEAVAEPSCANGEGGYTLGGRKFEKGKGEDHPLLKTLFK